MEIRKVVDNIHGIEFLTITASTIASAHSLIYRDFNTLKEAKEYIKIKKGTVLRIADEHETLKKFYTVKEVIPHGWGSEKEWYTLDGFLWDGILDRNIGSNSTLIASAIILPPVGSIIRRKNYLPKKIKEYRNDRIFLTNGNFYRIHSDIHLVQEP